MTKLKSLKEIMKAQVQDKSLSTILGSAVSIKLLRAEAIKDVKELRRKQGKYNPEEDWCIWGKGDIEGVIGYIMWKFNLTEEDLK